MTDPDRARKIKDIYNAAVDREVEDRKAFLREACLGDDELLHEIESLLKYEAAAENFIEKPALQALAEVIVESEAIERKRPIVGLQFGSYEVIKALGSGGMGEVYLAKDLRLGRQVALKLLPLRFTADLDRVRRFEQEARAASSLNHPNIITVYEIGQATAEAGEQRFIATEFIDGETLRQRLAAGRVSIESALELAAQVAAALVAAHEAGIIHRDIKPENIMLRRDGYLKVLDFGLAKLTEMGRNQAENDSSGLETTVRSASLTGPGVVMGTARYMSPEQARGLEVDSRSDIFSLGVVLYEMIAGTPPFTGPTMSDVIAAILTVEPQRLSTLVPEASPEVDRIVARALAKDRDARYASAAELLTDLKQLREELSFSAKLREHASENLQSRGVDQESVPRTLSSVLRRLKPKSLIGSVAAAAVIVALCGSSWLLLSRRNLQKARDQVSQIEKLAAEQRHFEAYDLALETLRYLPDDATIARLMPRISDNITITTEPAGARVHLTRFIPDSQNASSELIGVTPIRNLRVARGEYLLTIEKEGFAPFKRTISSRMYDWGTATLPPDEPTTVNQRLIATSSLPRRMVLVPGGEYGLVSWDKPTEARVRLDDYFIDEFEVTNSDYLEFVTAGGYLNRQYWKYPFVKGQRTLSWDEAMAELKDRTKLPGPRQWSGQKYPEGRGSHPVTDITWYEAAAYATFRGKTLPTVFQWEKAARNGLYTHYSANIMPWGPIDVSRTTDGRANFKSDGTKPVGSFEFGLSPFGCYDMAGNVAEWCLNETTDGYIALGASWDDPAYLFGYVGELPAFHSSGKLGFRCVLNLSEKDQGATKIDTLSQTPSYRPTDEATFRRLADYYRYDRGALDAKVVGTTDTADWRREKVTYIGARDEQVIAYLYLPKNYPPPFQVIQFVPAGDVYGGFATLTDSLEMVLSPHIKAGRAVFSVVFKGFKEREYPQGYVPPKFSSVKRREEYVSNATDLRRGLDYLETRPEIDVNRVAYLGYSQGSTEGIIYASLDQRYRAVVFVAGGLWPPGPRALPEVTAANFAGHILAPKLLINGRYDEVHSLKKLIEPLYLLLREKKKLVLYDGSHSPPIEIAVPVINEWLDETLGPVRR